MVSNKIYSLYLELLRLHGEPIKFWPIWCKARKAIFEREKVAFGAILTQRTSWWNAQMALDNLGKANLLSVKAISQLSGASVLEQPLRPAGFYRAKSRCLFGFCNFLMSGYGGMSDFMKEDLSEVRRKLLELYGIGPETADTILLYAMGKPSFVIDEYTERLLKKRGFVSNFDYGFLKKLFEKSLPLDASLYADFHALIVIDQKGENGSMMRGED
jgi:endonuclease-3 related protein